jgi:hypothetical protein
VPRFQFHSNEGVQFDSCLHVIVVEHGVQHVVVPRLITCCDEALVKIAYSSLSLRSHVAYIFAFSPNPWAGDDVLYKDSV